MTLKSHVILTALVLSCFPQLAIAQGNLVVNGGFTTNANGWTLTGAAFANSKNGNPPPDVVLGGGQTASQTINSLSPGTLYNVSGDYCCYGSDHTNISFEVSVNGVLLFETAAPTNLNWNSFNFGYAATSSSAVLELSQTYWAYLSVGDYSIDNIAMYAVPEPSAISLIFLGSGVLIYVRKPVAQPPAQAS